APLAAPRPVIRTRKGAVVDIEAARGPVRISFPPPPGEQQGHEPASSRPRYGRSMPVIHRAAVSEIDPLTLYRILWLRVSVFVVEQQAAYPELDGRDIEPYAELLWIEDDGRVRSEEH